MIELYHTALVLLLIIADVFPCLTAKVMFVVVAFYRTCRRGRRKWFQTNRNSQFLNRKLRGLPTYNIHDDAVSRSQINKELFDKSCLSHDIY